MNRGARLPGEAGSRSSHLCDGEQLVVEFPVEEKCYGADNTAGLAGCPDSFQTSTSTICSTCDDFVRPQAGS
jgi:hypothetical protein